MFVYMHKRYAYVRTNSHTCVYTQGEGWKDKYDKDSLDDSWDEMKDEQPSKMPDHHFLLQASLVKFLDKRAPLPSKIHLTSIQKHFC